jgi:hypothetical protein
MALESHVAEAQKRLLPCEGRSLFGSGGEGKVEKQKQVPFGFAQGRLSTHHPQAEKRLGPRSLRMTAQFCCQPERA